MDVIEIGCPCCSSQHYKHEVSSKAQMHSGSYEFNFVKCINCDLVYLNPVTSLQQLDSYYKDFYLPYRGAKAWGKYAPFAKKGEHDLDNKRVKFIQKFASLNKKSRVLDVGCGRPSFIKKLNRHTGCQAWGLDFKITGWKDEQEFDRINLIEGEVKGLPESTPFDLITMWHYLEHDYEPLITLKKLKKVSHKNTLLVIEVPDYACINRKPQGSHWAGYHTPRHVSVFERKTLKELLERSGWKECNYFKNGTLNPYILWWLGKKEQQGIDWSKSLEPHFLSFLFGYILSTPLTWLTRPFLHQGIQLAVFKPA